MQELLSRQSLLTAHWKLMPKEAMVFYSFKQIPSYFLKILCLACLIVLLAVPVPAQEQAPKDQGTPPAAPPPSPAAKPSMAPPPMPREYQAEKARSPKRDGQDLQMKGVDDTVGGQEIRNKKGPEEK
jgi:hypothetical protein